MNNFLKKLEAVLSRKDKQFLLLLVLFSILISFVEMIGISAIMPFIVVATDFSVIHSNHIFNKLYVFFSFDSSIQFIVVFGIILILFYIARSLLNLLYFHLMARFAFGRHHVLANRLFKIYLNLSYQNFLKLNSSALTKVIVTEAHNLTLFLQNFLFVISEIFVAAFIYIALLFVNYKITLLLTIVLAIKILLMTKTITKSIKKAGQSREQMQKDFFEIINRSFQNFQMLKFSTEQDKFLDSFAEASGKYAKANIVNASYAHVPRLSLEAIGFSLIIFIILYLIVKNQEDASSAIGLLSVYILALYRLMPSANRILTSYNQMMFYKNSLNIVHENILLKTEENQKSEIVFTEKFEFVNVSFSYEPDKPVLKNLSFTISKGEHIAIIGESGNGKSTLVNIISGLMHPTEGSILIDNVPLSKDNIVSWRQKFGYIPQNIYLFDGTIAENVAFGRYIDEGKIISVLKQAKIYDFVQSKGGIYTLVGEGGRQLSGGQKQRIAIARALYDDPEVLILDEATSALDKKVEAEFLNDINSILKHRTVILITHSTEIIDSSYKKFIINQGKINV
ncbi:MAG: ABC transporter ATP-binding protein [Campylobacterales bacterium]|nr:ABC transporter ATP-binding protein [Campylobacterales bacterium]